MEKGKKYISDYKGSRYNIFFAPNDNSDTFSVSIYKGSDYVGALKNVVENVTQGLQEASSIIVSYHKNQKKSSVSGEETPAKKGTIKLAWIDGDKTDSVLHSETYNTIQEALQNVGKDKKKWFIFKSIGNNDTSWEIQPYGDYKDYSRGVNVTSNFLVKTGVFVLSALGVYFIFTKVKPLIFKS